MLVDLLSKHGQKAIVGMVAQVARARRRSLRLKRSRRPVVRKDACAPRKEPLLDVVVGDR